MRCALKHKNLFYILKFNIMNKFYFILAMLLSIALPTVAQETDVSEEEFRQKVDSVFEHVDLPDGTYSLVLTENSETILRQTVIIKH